MRIFGRHLLVVLNRRIGDTLIGRYLIGGYLLELTDRYVGTIRWYLIGCPYMSKQKFGFFLPWMSLLLFGLNF